VARFVIAADCGTTAVRSLAFDVGTGSHRVCFSEPVPPSFPRPGWVEIDPETIAQATVRAVRAAFDWVAQDDGTVAALGLTNMRESAFAWRRPRPAPRPGLPSV
jgi:glycerol kinase